MSDFNATECVGLIAFAGAAIANGIAAAGRSRHRGLFVAATVLYLLLTVEVYSSGRHRLGNALRAVLHSENDYGVRRPVQAGLLVLVAAAVPLAALALGRRFAGRARGVVRVAFGAIAVFAVETISFHYVDSILYQRIGGVMVVGWCWLVAGVAAVIAASMPRTVRDMSS